VSTPKVSICIPAFEQPEGLRRLLTSVSEQSFRDFEVVVTDDSGDSRVEAVVREFAALPLRYQRNKRPLGSPANWNECVGLSVGEYVKIMHHDDWFAASDSLARFVAMLDECPGADLAFSGCKAVGPDGSVEWRVSPAQISALRRSPEALFPVNFLGGPSSTIYRRRVVRTFDERLKWVVDIDFYMAVLRACRQFACTDASLVCVTVGSDWQVTAACRDNREVEVFEWVTLTQKLCPSTLWRRASIAFLWWLFLRHGIRSVRQVLAVGVRPPLPLAVVLAVTLARFFPRGA